MFVGRSKRSLSLGIMIAIVEAGIGKTDLSAAKWAISDQVKEVALFQQLHVVVLYFPTQSLRLPQESHEERTQDFGMV